MVFKQREPSYLFNMSEIVEIPLYYENGTASDYYIALEPHHKKYYLTKRIPEDEFSDRTTYVKIVIKCIENPLDITLHEKKLCIDSRWLSQCIQLN